MPNSFVMVVVLCWKLEGLMAHHRFRDLLKTLDSLSSELHRQGIGATKNSAKVIDPKHDDVFWQKSLLVFPPPRFCSIQFFSMWGSSLSLGVYRNSMTLCRPS